MVLLDPSGAKVLCGDWPFVQGMRRGRYFDWFLEVEGVCL